MVAMSPLRSLMDDQVQYLCNQCIPAIAITDDDDPETIQQVLNVSSPECLLSTGVWRGNFNARASEKS